MSIFERKKRKNGLEAFGDETGITIKPYAPHQNISPVGYTETKAMCSLKQSFEHQIKRFLDRTSPDKYNSSFADSIIAKAKEQGLMELDIQRSEHIRCIERSISALWKGDEVSYERLLKQYDAEYERRKSELVKLKAIYQNNTSLSDSKGRSAS